MKNLIKKVSNKRITNRLLNDFDIKYHITALRGKLLAKGYQVKSISIVKNNIKEPKLLIEDDGVSN